MKCEIDKLALVCIQEGRLLCARSAGKALFYIPGGKREQGEDDRQALIREINEELGVVIEEATIHSVGTFTAQADGKTASHMVKVTCYQAQFSGEPKASSEIAELAWLTAADKTSCSLVTQKIIDALVQRGLLLNEPAQAPLITRYDWVLFDADNTLFHFNDFAGLQAMFKKYDVDFSASDYEDYKKINKPLWVQYQNGKITAHNLQLRRFTGWAEKIGKTTEELNTAFLNSMVACCPPLDGAAELLAALKDKVKIGIITNGFTVLHDARLNYHGLRHYIDLLVVSEAVGIAKPDKRIFKHALSQMGKIDPARVLMVGDTPASDIQGGNNMGLDTCWLNHHSQAISDDITPTFQVTSLLDLQKLLLGKR